MTKISVKSLIDGRWIEPHGPGFTSFNPCTGESFNAFLSCGAAEVDAALAAASEAWRVMRRMDGATIAGFLDALADEIEALGDTLLETCDAETGLGLVRLTGERGRTTGQIRAFAAIARKGEWVQASIDTALPDRQPVPKPDLRRMMRGIGPVAVFGASNFPFAFSVAGGDTASALAAGNPVVVKGHPAHPATSELFARAFESAIEKTGVPTGAFALLQSADHEAGAELVRHPAVQAVGFTGSLAGGRALMDLAAARRRPIPVYAEMGSVNPVFLGPNTLAGTGAAIAAGLSGSVCMGTGQFCTSPGLAILVKNPAFEDQMKMAMDDAPRGHLLNPGIRDALHRGLQERIGADPKNRDGRRHAVDLEVRLIEPLHPFDRQQILQTAVQRVADAGIEQVAPGRGVHGHFHLTFECRIFDQDRQAGRGAELSGTQADRAAQAGRDRGARPGQGIWPEKYRVDRTHLGITRDRPPPRRGQVHQGAAARQ